MRTADRLRELLAVDQPEDRLPLVSLAEARAAVLLLQELGEGTGETELYARDLAARIARRLPAEG